MTRARAPADGISRLHVEDAQFGWQCDSDGPFCGSPILSVRSVVPELGQDCLKLQRLGKGASSSVYMAICVRTLAVVALKESPIRTAADRDAVRSELQALRTQRSPLMDRSFVGDDTASPHIVRFYGGVMLQERTAVLAVELVAGGSLQAFIDRGSPAPEPWLAHVAHSCLLALQTLHENGRTHRDIKPANCLITCEGDAKLADFGCASGDLGRRMVGTRRYLPPEVLKGEAVLPKSDVWSFGLTMAAAACADPPVAQAQNEFEQLQAAERVRTTIAQLHNISPQLHDFLSLCLVVNPSERASIAELLEHPFLQRRQGWRASCADVLAAIRAHRLRVWMPVAEVIAEVAAARADRGLDNTNILPIALRPLSLALDAPVAELAAAFRLAAALQARASPGSAASSYNYTGLGAPALRRPHSSHALSRKWSQSSELDGSCSDSIASSSPRGADGSSGGGDGCAFTRHAASAWDPACDSLGYTDAEICALADRMIGALDVRHRVSRLRRYRSCFVGREAVRWLRAAGAAASAAHALALGNEMLRMGVFSHVTAEHVFEDEHLFYRFSDDMVARHNARRQRRARRSSGGGATAGDARGAAAGVCQRSRSSGALPTPAAPARSSPVPLRLKTLRSLSSRLLWQRSSMDGSPADAPRRGRAADGGGRRSSAAPGACKRSDSSSSSGGGGMVLPCHDKGSPPPPSDLSTAALSSRRSIGERRWPSCFSLANDSADSAASTVPSASAPACE